MRTFFLKLSCCLCFCSLASIVAAQSASFPSLENTMRVMSYNIRNACGMDDKVDYERIASIIRNVAPDVVALQELDSVTTRYGQVDVLATLGNLTRMYGIYGASIDYQGGKYGVGILSKEKPLSWKRVPLPGREEARSLLIVEFDKYVLGCTHFSLTPEDRLASIQIVNREASAYQKPVLLAGDINALPESPEATKLMENWKVLNNPKQFTFPSTKADSTIDYIMGYTAVGQSYSVLQSKVLNEPVASDHLPLFVDVRFKADVSSIFQVQPYLQCPSTTGIAIMWHTTVPCHSWVEYGTDPSNLQRARTFMEGEAIANNKLNRIELTGLKPGTTYYYRVHSREITLYQPYKKEFGETASTEMTTFKTLNNATTDFTAIVFNDIHDSYPLFDKLFAQVKDVPYDIVFFNGDCIADVQNEAKALQTIGYYSKHIRAHQIPSIYMRGNHETRGAYSPFLWNLLGKVSEHSYGALNIGDTRFVLMDCGEDKPDDTPVYYDLNDFTQYRKDQAAFLQKEISSKEFRSAQKKVLIHHIPVYGMKEETFVPCRDLWGDVLAKASFNLCLNGHTHSYNYLPKGTEGNNFPVVIGGGSNETDATVMILQKKGKVLTLKVINTKGETLQTLDL